MIYAARIRQRIRTGEHVPLWILEKLGFQSLNRRKPPLLSSLDFDYDEAMQDRIIEDLDGVHGWELLFLSSKLLVARMHGHEPSFEEDAKHFGVSAAEVENLYAGLIARYEVPYDPESGSPDLYYLRQSMLPSRREPPGFYDLEWQLLFNDLHRLGDKAWRLRPLFKIRLEESLDDPKALKPLKGLRAPANVSQMFFAKMQAQFGSTSFAAFGHFDYTSVARVLRFDFANGLTGPTLEYVHAAMLALGFDEPSKIDPKALTPLKFALQHRLRETLNEAPLRGVDSPDFGKEYWFANSMLLEIQGLQERRAVYPCPCGFVDIAESAVLPTSVNCEECGEVHKPVRLTLLQSLANEPDFASRVLYAYRRAAVV